MGEWWLAARTAARETWNLEGFKNLTDNNFDVNNTRRLRIEIELRYWDFSFEFFEFVGPELSWNFDVYVLNLVNQYNL